MTTTRRTFMKQIGVTLAALLASGCLPPTPPPTPMCYAPAAPTTAPASTSTPTPAPTPYPMPTCYAAPPPTAPAVETNENWEALRVCWLDLKDPRLGSSGGAAFSSELLRRHRDALTRLQTAGQLDSEVASAMVIAFDEATVHVQRKMATCYEPLPPGQPNPHTSREELTTQAATLTEMAARSVIDPATVARARAALERDLAWLAQFQAGRQPGELEEIRATPAEVEAARLLVELLLKRT
jgi:hypothetical protein